ncbi:hypothetical protein [Tissierella praeacuta]
MYFLLLICSAALILKAYYAAQTDNFILFIVCIFISNIFTLVARKER